jgi:hypothetical protein
MPSLGVFFFDDGHKYRKTLCRCSGNSPHFHRQPTFVDCSDDFSNSYSVSDFGLVGRGDDGLNQHIHW